MTQHTRELVAVSADGFEAWTKNLPRRTLCSRDALILDLCRNKTVLHLGAADAPMTAAKLQSGDLLHLKLRSVTASLMGLDSERSAIDLITRATGVADITLADLSSGTIPLLPDQFSSPDIILCCDIIEHVTNCSTLLGTVHALAGPSTLIVVSTINALSIKAAMRAFFGREAVHPAHVAYYSYGTLGQALSKACISPQFYATFGYPTASVAARALFNVIHRAAPNTADGIIMVGRKCISPS